MPSPLISIVIVQYNNSQNTIECLESVKELNYSNYSVIVIDNSSDVNDFNSTRFFIESLQDERFKIINSNKNLGYSGGNNLGIKKALRDGVDSTGSPQAEYIFILNPDVTIENDTLTKLLEAAEIDPRIGIVGSIINESDQIIYGGKIEWLKPELQHSEATLINPHTLDSKSYLIGAAMLIKKEVIEKVGLFDERYFLYFEDVDFCVRAQEAGFKLQIAETKIKHTSQSTTSKLGSSKLLHYHYRNAHLFNWKNSPLYIKFTLPFWSFLIILKQLIKIAFMPSKRDVSKAILAGVADFYGKRFGKIND